jgi:hypothetical protein
MTMKLGWTRIPTRGGFPGTGHWRATAPDGRVYLIYQRVRSISRRTRIVSASLILPNNAQQQCTNVTEAKALADFDVNN